MKPSKTTILIRLSFVEIVKRRFHGVNLSISLVKGPIGILLLRVFVGLVLRKRLKRVSRLSFAHSVKRIFHGLIQVCMVTIIIKGLGVSVHLVWMKNAILLKTKMLLGLLIRIGRIRLTMA